MSLIHNEKTKLTAAWLNTLASAIITTGVVAPVVALLMGFSVGAAISKLTIACKVHAREIEAMNWFEIYALFGSPLILLLVCFGVVWLTGIEDKRDRRSSTPAE